MLLGQFQASFLRILAISLRTLNSLCPYTCTSFIKTRKLVKACCILFALPHICFFFFFFFLVLILQKQDIWLIYQHTFGRERKWAAKSQSCHKRTQTFMAWLKIYKQFFSYWQIVCTNNTSVIIQSGKKKQL